jgi:hypothetical protein
MLRFDIIIIGEKTSFAGFQPRVKAGTDNCRAAYSRRLAPPRYFSGVEMIAVVIERGSRISQRPASTRSIKSPQN